MGSRLSKHPRAYETKVAGTNKLRNMAQDRLSYSRLAKGRILIVCNSWHNAEDGSIDKSDELFIGTIHLLPK
jgi:hypothetical protein